MSALLPLWAERDLEAPLAWRAGGPISARQFLADVASLAARLPAEARIVNLCADRYRFAVALAASWSRGLLCLLPPNALPETLANLDGGGLPLCALIDDADAVIASMPVLRVDAPQPGDVVAVPRLPADAEVACLLTSGSTGQPQPHAKRWGALMRNIAAEADRLAQMLQRPDLQGLTLVASVQP